MVAYRSGRPLLAVARDPYALTYYQYLIVKEQERLDRLTDKANRMELVNMTAFAMHKPSELRGFSDDFLLEVRGAHGRRLADEAPAMKTIEHILAQLKKVPGRY